VIGVSKSRKIGPINRSHSQAAPVSHRRAQASDGLSAIAELVINCFGAINVASQRHALFFSVDDKSSRTVTESRNIVTIHTQQIFIHNVPVLYNIHTQTIYRSFIT